MVVFGVCYNVVSLCVCMCIGSYHVVLHGSTIRLVLVHESIRFEVRDDSLTASVTEILSMLPMVIAVLDTATKVESHGCCCSGAFTLGLIRLSSCL